MYVHVRVHPHNAILLFHLFLAPFFPKLDVLPLFIGSENVCNMFASSDAAADDDAVAAAAADDDDDDDDGDDYYYYYYYGVMMVATVMTRVFGFVRVGGGSGDLNRCSAASKSHESRCPGRRPHDTAQGSLVGMLRWAWGEALQFAQFFQGTLCSTYFPRFQFHVQDFLDTRLRLYFFEYLWWIGLVPCGEEGRQWWSSYVGRDSKTPL